MREIKFRGLYKGTWVYGNLIQGLYDGKPFTQIEKSDSNDFCQWEVDPESVGQYTGLKDKNGKEICEGDIMALNTKKQPTAIIEFGYCGYVFKWIDKVFIRVRQFPKEPIFPNVHLFEVIGNIHENKDLL